MLKRLLLFPALLCLILLWTLAETSILQVNEQVLTLEDWPGDGDTLTVAVLADIHTGSPFNGPGKLRRIVHQTNQAKPDIVLLAGDFVIHGVVGGSYEHPQTTAELLADLEAPTYAVLGNHDWWLGADTVASALKSVGITMMDDRSELVRAGGHSFRLVGLGDLWEGSPDPSAAFEGLSASDRTLVFTHNPDIFPDVDQPFDLMIAGHTHGGQVDLPFLGPPNVPSKYGKRYASGLVVEDGKKLFVSTGLGTSILPVRFRVPPEILVLRLVGAGPVKESGRPDPELVWIDSSSSGL